MDFSGFAVACDLVKRREVEKVALAAFYHFKTHGVTEFAMEDICEWFDSCHLAKPNVSRLRSNLTRYPAVVRGTASGTFRLHAKEIARLSAEYPALGVQTEEVVSYDWILPESLFKGTRGFVEGLARQVNASYEHNVFDGCAVLMRRLLEVLLILTYRHLNVDDQIKDAAGNFVVLDQIIGNAKANVALGLSRNTKASLDEFRKLGNFSAHKIEYICRKEDIRRVLLDYRAATEELIYKAGLKV